MHYSYWHIPYAFGNCWKYFFVLYFLSQLFFANKFLFLFLNKLFFSIMFNILCHAYFFWQVFWVNIAKSEVNLRYRNGSNLFEILRREIEFQYYRCRNSTKSMRENKKKVERENVEFRQRRYRISCAQFCCPCAWSARSEKKKKIDKLIVAMPLSK